MMKKTLKEGTQIFDLFNMEKLHENLLDLLVIFIALITLLVMFIYGLSNKYVFDKKFAYILLSIYAIFLVSSTFIAVFQAFF